MRLNKRVVFLSFVSIVLLVLLVGFGVAKYYENSYNKKIASSVERTKSNFKLISTYLGNEYNRSVNEYIEYKKEKSEIFVKRLNTLFDEQNSKIEDEIKADLKNRVYIAYDSSNYIYKRYQNKRSNKNRIIEINSNIISMDKTKPVFMTNFNGDSVLLANQNIDRNNFSSYLDADIRSIILEEIQKVRKRGEGFLESNFYTKDSKYIIFVKKLDMYNLFIGAMQSVEESKNNSKKVILEMIQNMPMDKSEFVNIYENKKLLFSSLTISGTDSVGLYDEIDANITQKSGWYKDKTEGYLYYCDYNEGFNWNIVYGFNIATHKLQEMQRKSDVENMLDIKRYF